MATQFNNIMEGVKERKLSTEFTHLRIHYVADPLKRGDWAKRHSVRYFGMESPRWRREQEIDYRAYSGQRIWPMLSGTYHDAKIDISKLTLYRVIDQGIRHPFVCLWVAVNAQKDRHIYREYYATDRSIAMNCRTVLSLTPPEERITANYIDPATRKRSEESLTSLISIYEQNGLFCQPADNSFSGYDKVATSAMSTLARIAIKTGVMPPYLEGIKPSQAELLILAQAPSLTFDTRFTDRAFTECANLRWRDTKGDETQKAPMEKPVDKDDDGPDCVRYSIATGLQYVPDNSTISFKDFDYRKLESRKNTRRDIEKIYQENEMRACYE
jgi:hypothetical protein